MPSLKDLKNQLTAIKKTQSITKAMYNLANSKVAAAQRLFINQNVFNKNLDKIISDLYVAFNYNFDLDDETTYKVATKNLYILITSDRGLVGGYHQKLFRYLDEIVQADSDFEILTIGKKGHYHTRKKGYDHFNKDEVLINRDNVFINPVDYLGDKIISNFISKQYKGVYVVYNEFLNSIEFSSVTKQIFPIVVNEKLNNKSDFLFSSYFIIEENKKDLLKKILPLYVSSKLFTVLCAAKASEHAARKNSMKNASDNALDIIRKLQTKYNQLRQENITTELIDIINGSNV